MLAIDVRHPFHRVLLLHGNDISHIADHPSSNQNKRGTRSDSHGIYPCRFSRLWAGKPRQEKGDRRLEMSLVSPVWRCNLQSLDRIVASFSSQVSWRDQGMA